MQLDRTQFTDVIESKSRAELEKRPRRKYARKPDPRPRMVEAYLFFYNQLVESFIGDQSDIYMNSWTSKGLKVEEWIY